MATCLAWRSKAAKTQTKQNPSHGTTWGAAVTGQLLQDDAEDFVAGRNKGKEGRNWTYQEVLTARPPETLAEHGLMG